jgi:hypothetical protein
VGILLFCLRGLAGWPADRHWPGGSEKETTGSLGKENCLFGFVGLTMESNWLSTPKRKFNQRTFKNLHRTRCFAITNTSRLMLFREMVDVYPESYVNPMNTSVIMPGDAYKYHHALKGLK